MTYAAPPIKTVKKEDGLLTLSRDEYDERWIRYFAGVFSAEVVDSLASVPFFIRNPRDPSSDISGPSPPSWERICRGLLVLPLGKSVGPDNISAERMRVHVLPFAAFLFHLLHSSWPLGCTPIMWRGGRLSELHKKLDTLVCDNYRGLLVSDHLSKLYTSCINDFVHDHYIRNISVEQCGGIRGKGTGLATHTLRTAIDLCIARSKPLAILFIDLSKAFDRVIREFALGWPSITIPSKRALLVSLGLSEDRADEVLASIDSGDTILNEIGVPKSVVDALNSLHTGAWFQFGRSSRFIITKVGGRQGCRFGGIIFNLCMTRL